MIMLTLMGVFFSVPGSLKRKIIFWGTFFENPQHVRARVRPVLITPLEAAELYALLAQVQSLLQDAGIAFFLESGSLLGAARHQGLIPWDDDIDLSVEMRDEKKLLTLMKEVMPRYGFRGVLERGFIWKISSEDKPHVWVDIFLVTSFEDDTVHYAAKQGRCLWPQNYYRKAEIFNKQSELDCVELPFGPLQVKAPRGFSKYLDRAYGGWRRYAIISRHSVGYVDCVLFSQYPELKRPVLWDRAHFDQCMQAFELKKKALS